MKYYYAFKYSCGLNTTTTSGPNGTGNYIIAGRAHRFESKVLRDAFVNKMDYSINNNQKPCKAVKRAEISRMGHGWAFKENSDYFDEVE